MNGINKIASQIPERPALDDNISDDTNTLTDNPIEIKLGANIVLKSPPKEILNQAISENTFENPIFKSNEENCRSNWQTDPTITTYSYQDDILTLPRGYGRALLKVVRDSGFTPQIVDERITNPCVFPDELIGIILRNYQQRAISEALHFNQGVIVAPTGSGKTIIGLEIIRNHGQKSLVIVSRADLAKQWIKVIEDVLGLKSGFIGDGQWIVGEQITVAMIQTLSAREKDALALSNVFGLVIAEECQHVPAEGCFKIMNLIASKFRYGLSATIMRRDGLEEMIYRSLGPVISTISKTEVECVGAVVPATVVCVHTGFAPGPVYSWNDYLTAIACNANRNLLIIDLANRSEGAALILVDRVSHAEQLSEMLTRRNIDHVLAHGKIAKRDRETIIERIKSSKITVGTSSLLGEGIDVAVWGTLIMASPISSEIKLLQCVGRIVRPAKGKEIALVYDLNDEHALSGASFNKRFEIYKKNRIWVEFR